MKRIRYLIARPWSEETPDDLCIYVISSHEIHQGTIAEAKSDLEYVNSRCDPKHIGKYHIYPITIEKPI